MSTKPGILEGDSVLPPMGSPDRGSRREPERRDKPKRRAKGASGRFGTLNAFVDETLRQLDRTAACVWLLLFRDTKPDGTACTGQTDIARRVGVSVRAVYRALRRLRESGLLIVVRKGRLNVGPTVYRIRATRNKGS